MSTKTTTKTPATFSSKNLKGQEYFEAIGRRKTSVARVRLSKAKGLEISINGKPMHEYFPVMEWREKVLTPLKIAQMENGANVSVKVKGGGIASQADAAAHGIGRALIEFNQELRKTIKKGGFLKRDPRMKERRKFGLKKARKAPQWSKR
ncbi:MAG TPA: 30S ribosomal protein S9 [Candidatus Paceibacterota bacterium]